MSIIINQYAVAPAVITPVDPATITSGLSALYDITDAGSLTLSGANVLTVNDLSGNTRHLTGTNNPQYSATNGGTITFNGTNNYLSRSSAWLYDGGAATMIAVVKCNGGSGLAVINEGRSTNGSPVYQQIRSHFSNSDDDIYGFIRNDANVNNLLNTSPLGNAQVFNDVRKVVTVIDTGALVSSLDGLAQGLSPQAYTRANPVTLDRFAIGALVRNTVGGYVPMEFNYLATWNRALPPAEYQGAIQFLKNKFTI